MSIASTSSSSASGNYHVSPKRILKPGDKGYRSEKFFSWVEHLTSGKNDSFKNANGASYRLRKFGAMLLDYDTRSFNKIGKLSIPASPIGSLLLLLFPVVIGSRYIQAAKRDPKGVEKYDVLRRDFTTLTLFVFMLKPLVNLINGLRQRVSGLNLVHKADSRDLLGKTFAYSELAEAYRLNSAAKIEALIAEGNANGLAKAAKKIHRMYARVLGPVTGGDQVLDAYKKFENIAVQLKEESAKFGSNGNISSLQNPKSSPQITHLSQAAHEALEVAQASLKKFEENLASQGIGSQVLNTYSKNKKNLPTFANTLVHHARMTRFLADIIGIASVGALMGWGPVKLNDVLSRNRLHNFEVDNTHNHLPPVKASSPPAIRPSHALRPNPFSPAAVAV